MDRNTLQNTSNMAKNSSKKGSTIDEMRNEIDAIDAQLLLLLSNRMQCAKTIGNYKKEHNLPVFQADRWQEILNTAIQKGQQLGLSEQFITELLTAIHDESVRQQKEIIE